MVNGGTYDECETMRRELIADSATLQVRGRPFSLPAPVPFTTHPTYTSQSYEPKKDDGFKLPWQK